MPAILAARTARSELGPLGKAAQAQTAEQLALHVKSGSSHAPTHGCISVLPLVCSVSQLTLALRQSIRLHCVNFVAAGLKHNVFEAALSLSGRTDALKAFGQPRGFAPVGHQLKFKPRL